MTNFRSLNSSKANQQSVKDHTEEAETSMQQQVKEKKDSAFNKYNINGEKRRGEGEPGH
jgi:hypothetical protein